MNGPENLDLPFFAYGFFRPGEISFMGIKDYVFDVKPVIVKGEIKHRDGLNFYLDNQQKTVDGYLIYFHSGMGKMAYDFINSMEPNKLFTWRSGILGDVPYNVLYGKKPTKGSVENQDEFGRDSVWQDPFFTVALEDTLLNGFVDGNPKIENLTHDKMFKLQMKYMLLWTIIERFIFLRYSFGGEVVASTKKFSENLFLKEALNKFGFDNPIKRDLYATNYPKNKIRYSKDDSIKAINYYYQVRCNITHRGKGVHQDLKLLENCYTELYNILIYVLRNTRHECMQVKQQYEDQS